MLRKPEPLIPKALRVYMGSVFIHPLISSYKRGNRQQPQTKAAFGVTQIKSNCTFISTNDQNAIKTWSARLYFYNLDLQSNLFLKDVQE